MVWCCLNSKKTCNDEIIIETSERLLITDGKRNSNSWSSEKVSGGNSVVNLLYSSYDSRKKSDDTADDSTGLAMDQAVIRQPIKGEDILIKTNSSAIVAYSNKNDSVKSEGSPIAKREKVLCTSTQTESNVIAAPLMKIREKSRMMDSTDNDEIINGNKKDKKIGNDEIINVKKETKPNKKDQSTSPMKNEEPTKEKDDEESMYENTPHYAQNLPRINHNKRHSQNSTKDTEQNKNRKSCFSGKYNEITEDVIAKEVFESIPLDLSSRRRRSEEEPLDLCTKRDESLGSKPDLLSSCGDDIANEQHLDKYDVSYNFHKYKASNSHYNVDGYNSYNDHKRYNTSKSNEHSGYYPHQQLHNKPHTLHQTHFISAHYKNIHFNTNNIYVNEATTTINTASYCNLPEPLYFQYDNNTYILPKKTKNIANNSSYNIINSHDNTVDNAFNGGDMVMYKFNDKNIDNIDDYDSLDDYLMGGCEVISNTEALNLVIKPENEGGKDDGKTQTEYTDKTDSVVKGEDVKKTSILLPVKVKCNINTKQIKNHHKKNEKKKKSKGKVKEDRKLSVEDIVVPARQTGSLSKQSITSSTPKKKSRNIFNSFKNNYKNNNSIGSNLSSASSSSSLSCNYLHISTQHHNISNNNSSLSNILNNNNSSLSNILDNSPNNASFDKWNARSYNDFNFTTPLDTYPSPPILLANPSDDFLACNLKLLYMCPFYWGSLDVKGSEDVLMSHNEGSFIVRSSSDEDCVVSLSFKSLNSCHHTRVQYLKGSFSFHIATSDTTTTTVCYNIVHFISQAVDDCINSSNNILNISNNNNNNSSNKRNNNSFNNRNNNAKNPFKNIQEAPTMSNNNDNNYWLYLERTRHGEVTRVPVKLFNPLLCPHAPSNETTLPSNHKPPRVSSANQKQPSNITPANHKPPQATSRQVVSLRLLSRRSLVASRSKQQVQKMAMSHWLKGYILIGYLISQ